MDADRDPNSIVRFTTILIASYGILFFALDLLLPKGWNNGYVAVAALLWCVVGLDRVSTTLGSVDNVFAHNRNVLSRLLKASLLTVLWPVWVMDRPERRKR